VTNGGPEEQLQILVVAGLLTGEMLRDEDRAVRQLVMSLSQQCRDSALTVLTTDPRSPATAAAAYRDLGIRVIEGEQDWAGELSSNPFLYSHVFFTDSTLRSAARQRIADSQPQATKVAYFSRLSFREVAALAPIVPRNERDGLDYVRAQTEEWLVEDARFADAAWCELHQDAAFLASLLPELPVAVVPPVLEPSDLDLPFVERRGVLLVATEGHDVLAGNEDAALLAMEEVLPGVARRGSSAECVLVTDWPSPMLESAAARRGVAVVGSRDLARALGRARVVLVTHNYGSGGGTIIRAALASGTPFVATPQAALGCALGRLEELGVRGTPADLVQCVRRLLLDDEAWSEFAATSVDFLEQCHSEDVRARAVRAALPGLGIVPRRPALVVLRARDLGARRRALRPVSVDLRPAGTPEPSPLERPEPTDAVERYELWADRFGPTPSVLRAIEAELQQLDIRPMISVLMPVYNTDPDILLAAVDSVRAQIYGNWQLCVADDGSDRPETLDVLRGLRGDSRIVMTRLGGQSGISAATNGALALAEGEWVTLLDHDDLLKPHALAQVVRWINADPALDVIYSDEDKLDDGGHLVQPHLKPDWAPDQLMSHNYVCHLTVARRSMVEQIGGLRSEFDGSQDYDLVLRLADLTDRIAHIPEPLYTWRMVAGSTAVVTEAKPYALKAGRRALDDALERRGRAGRAEETIRGGIYRTRYGIPGNPRVAIIIPTKDRIDLLRCCVESVLNRSTYTNFEIMVVDNQSSDGETLEYLAHIPGRVIRYPFHFNYARMMNLGARAANADVLLFLNNDTEVISPDWIEALLEHALRPEVGAVGGRLYLGSGRPQHEGILVGVRGWANNIDYGGFWARGDVVRNVSAVTGACTMMRPSVYWAVGGNDERLRIAYNDVDICLRIRQAGLQVVYTPYAELYHYESSTRSGHEHHEDGPLFGLRWQPHEHVDPYYSPLMDPEQLFQIKL
jgi:GT2 family glycosyltransferase